jgi:hypothetical protein
MSAPMAFMSALESPLAVAASAPAKNAMCPDAVLSLPASDGAPRLHIFKDARTACWDVLNERLMPGYPCDTSRNWPGLLEQFQGRRLRAAFAVPEWGANVFFLFEGESKVVIWDLALGRAAPVLVDIEEILPCPFPAREFLPVVAQLPGGEPIIYGFHGVEYVRWTIGPKPPSGPDANFPRRLVDDWKDGLVLAPRAAVYVDWPNRSSAHFNRKLYFFMGNLYLRWDVTTHTRNYRLDIVSGWNGWPFF